jgi:hypothetical protein
MQTIDLVADGLHQPLPAVDPDQDHRSVRHSIAVQRQDLGQHLHPLGCQHPHPVRLVLVEKRRCRFEALHVRVQPCAGRFVGLEVGGTPGQQEAALAGFRILDRRKKGLRGRLRVAHPIREGVVRGGATQVALGDGYTRCEERAGEQRECKGSAGRAGDPAAQACIKVRAKQPRKFGLYVQRVLRSLYRDSHDTTTGMCMCSYSTRVFKS